MYSFRFLSTIILSLINISIYCQSGSWTWMKGNSSQNSLGHFGIQGVPDSSNTPPALFGTNGWVDHNGNLWLFGGSLGWDMYSDLWKFDISSNLWTWVNGSGMPNHPGVYGIPGVASESNLPKYREEFTTWTDLNGDLWLFGGADGMGQLNDLWRYQISSNKWTWMKGPNPDSNYVHYGIMTIPAPENNPPNRSGATGGWVDSNGDLWLFGGKNSWSLNDVWRFNISTNNWTWMAGSDTIQVPPDYGIQNVSSTSNTPGARGFYTSWKDSDGNFWLFGGENTILGYLYSDLWLFSPINLQWTWISGSNIANSPGNCDSIKCSAMTNNMPGSRSFSTNGWKGICDYFYFFGGYSGWKQLRSDLWCYNKSNNEWTFAKGSLNMNELGNHGTLGVSSPLNQPRSINGACTWTDLNGNFWIFGGSDSCGFFNNFNTNELWRYSPDTLCPAGQEVPTLSISPDTTICAGDSIMLNVSGGNYYHWTPETNISNPYISNPLVYPDTTTVYKVRIYVNKCSTELFVKIVVNTDSIFSVSPKDSLVCKGDTIELHSFGGDSVHWNPDTYLSNSNIHNPIAILDSNITYSINLSNSCFKRTLWINLAVYPEINKGIENNDTLICAGQSVILVAFGGIKYNWNTGQTVNCIIVAPNQQTNYSVNITDIYGCNKNDHTSVDVNPVPNIQIFAPESTICQGTPIKLTASGATFYKWSSKELLTDTTGPSIIVTPTNSNNFSVIGTGLNNCTNSDSIYISVVNCNVKIPNVFTPNNDGINDYFQVKYEGISNYDIKVFNRWGIQLFESNNVEIQWDGKYNEQEVSPGTYYYIVLVGDYIYKGTVTIIK
jgi:gliding motility-associated-like protein